MIRVQIEVQRKGVGWRVKFCTIYLPDRITMPIAMTDRLFTSQYGAVKDMRRQVLEFLTAEGSLDRSTPIDWQILPWGPVGIGPDGMP
ncbi:MAG: hypothetical protein AB7G68_05995 [Nitrospiraceae bacterium]